MGICWGIQSKSRCSVKVLTTENAEQFWLKIIAEKAMPTFPRTEVMWILVKIRSKDLISRHLMWLGRGMLTDCSMQA